MPRLWWGVALLAVMVQQASAQVGLLVVSHGADSSWNTRVEETLSRVRWSQGPVRGAFLMGSGATTSSWDKGVAELVAAGARSIIVVPLMVSTYGEHVSQIRYYAGELRELPASLASMGHEHHSVQPSPVPMRVTRAIDGASELGEILGDRWNALADSMRTGTLVLIAHGPSADSLVGGWLHSITAAAAPLSQRLGVSNVRIGLLRDDAPAPVRAAAIASLRDTVVALATRSGEPVTVMTVLVSSGSINRVKVPNDLEGMPMRYVGASLAPHPALSRWIERIATAALPAAQ